MYDNCSRSKGQGHVTYSVVCMSARLLDINMRRAERAKLIRDSLSVMGPGFPVVSGSFCRKCLNHALGVDVDFPVRRVIWSVW